MDEDQQSHQDDERPMRKTEELPSEPRDQRWTRFEPTEVQQPFRLMTLTKQEEEEEDERMRRLADDMFESTERQQQQSESPKESPKASTSKAPRASATRASATRASSPRASTSRESPPMAAASWNPPEETSTSRALQRFADLYSPSPRASRATREKASPSRTPPARASTSRASPPRVSSLHLQSLALSESLATKPKFLTGPTPYNLVVCEHSLPDLIWRDWERKPVDCERELTDYAGCLERIRQGPELRKVKIYGPYPKIRPARLRELLTPLSKLRGLEYLEIDRLVTEDRGEHQMKFDPGAMRFNEFAIPVDEPRREPDYEFRDLKFLRINSAAQAKEDGTEVTHKWYLRVLFGSEYLRYLHLGDDSIKYVEVVNKKEVVFLGIGRDLNGLMGEYQELRTLYYNDALNIPLVTLRNMTGTYLTELHLYVRPESFEPAAVSTSLKLTEEMMKKIEDSLKFLIYPNMGTKIFFQNLRVYPYKSLRDLRIVEHDLLTLAKRFQLQDNNGQVIETNYDDVVKNFDGDYINPYESYKAAANREKAERLRASSAFPPTGPIVSSYFKSAKWTDPRFRRFAEAFPYIQRVNVFNSDETRRFNLMLLCQFLCNCKVLAKLQCVSTGFSEIDYLRLSEQPTLASLLFLGIFEPSDYSKQLKNFEFLGKFKHLRMFNTNLANCPMALQLVTDHFRAPYGRFAFYLRSTFRPKFSILFVTSNRQEPNHYDLELVDTHEPKKSEAFSICRSNLTIDEMRQYLMNPEPNGIPADLLEHWMDKFDRGA